MKNFNIRKIIGWTIIGLIFLGIFICISISTIGFFGALFVFATALILTALIYLAVNLIV
ncbi:hypothetical protein M0Q97_09845 [Candidatus Dojkabacteria bacterium]|jgi:hypothetical protein|nr:hypothetical protein [Candidatus Dojkabacteria bacterium]